MNYQWVNKMLRILLFLVIMLPSSITLAYADEKSPAGHVFKPDDLKISPFAFVYGDLSNLDDTHDPNYSIQKLKDFPYIICASPKDLSEESMQVTDAIKPKTKLFGYVNLGPDNPENPENSWRYANLNKVKTEIDQIAESNWYGVFIDQFGYDFHETRQRQNEIIDYAHQKGLKCFVNAWFPDDAMGSANDAISNPTSEPTHLGSDDYYLIESFLMSDSFYRGDIFYLDKFLKIKKYHDNLGVNIVVLSYKRENTSWNQASDDIQLSYIIAQCLDYQGWWFGGWNGRADYWHLNPGVDIGKLIQPLQFVSGTRYLAQTDLYTIEYYADELPHLIAYPKIIDQPVITIRHQIPKDYIDTNQLTTQEALFIQKRLNDYGFTYSIFQPLKEDGIFGAFSKSALIRFLDANHYEYYSTDAQDLLSGNQAINALNRTGELKLLDKLLAILSETIVYLKEMGWSLFGATFFVTTNSVGSGMMNWDQLDDLAREGNWIGSHTVHHLDLATLSYSQQETELSISKQELINHLNINVQALCFPSGRYNKTTLELMSKLGYKLGFTTVPGKVHLGDDLLTLKRVRISGGMPLASFQKLSP